MCLVVGIPVSAFAGDAVTGIVAGVGAGGAIALRRMSRTTPDTRRRVAFAAAYSSCSCGWPAPPC